MPARPWILAAAVVLAALLIGTPTSLVTVAAFRTSSESAATPSISELPPLIDIPFFRSDALGRSVDPGPGPDSEPVVAWHTPYGASAVWPLLVSGLIIGGSSDGALVALDARTGEEHWRFAPSEGVTRSIGAADGFVFVDAPAHVYALDVTTGEQRWQADAPKPVRGVVVGAVVYVPVLGGAMSFDAKTGATVWQWQGLPSVSNNHIRVADGVAYIASNGGLYAIDLASNVERWHVQTISNSLLGIAIVGDTVYTSTAQGESEQPLGQLYAIDRASGAVRWVFRGPSSLQITGGPVEDDVVYANSESDGLFALRDQGSSATVVWHVDSPSASVGLTLSGDTLYEVRDDGSLGAYAKADGHLEWQTPSLDAPSRGPLVSGGMIFVANDQEGITAFAATDLVALLPPPAAPSQPPATPEATGPPDPFTIVKAIPWNETRLVLPLGLSVGPDGLVYVLDTKPSVTVIDPESGQIVRTWGRQGAGPGEFNVSRPDDNPGFGGIAVAPDGKVFVADGSNHRVQVFQADGTFISQFGSFGTGEGQFGSISEIALGPDDSVYLLDESLNAVSKFSQEGKFVWRLEAGKVGIPGPLHTPVVRPDGRVLITCEGCHGDQIIDAETGAVVGKYVIEWGDPDNSGNFDAAGNFYVASQFSMDDADDLVFDQDGSLIGDRHGTGSSVGRAQVERGSVFFPAPVFGPDGLAYSFNEEGLLQIRIGPVGE